MARELGRRDARDPGAGWLALDQLRKALPADAVLIDIARFDPFDFRAMEKPWRPARYVAWVVPPAGRGDVRLVDLGEAKKIDAAVGLVRKSLAGATGAIRARGGRLLTESESSCIVYGMPRAVHEAGLAEAEAPLHEMAALILRYL